MNAATDNVLPNPVLSGVHHTARPTWKLGETVNFYRDLLGLPLIHAISAKGWGPDDHADFLHFFFDSGLGSTIAFFYYIGTERPDWLAMREHYQQRATHTAWRVETREELLTWRERVEKVGIPFRYQIQHEVIESIYFNDPNGYPIEITWQMRPFNAADNNDAALTLQAAMELEKAKGASGEFKSIDPVWQRKASLIDPQHASNHASIYVLNVPEFSTLIDYAKEGNRYRITALENNYVRIDGVPELSFNRKQLRFNPAVWYGALTGGFQGRITKFDRDDLVIEGAA
ncbi:VOC family protein [Noviherbaspirillum saxi]|uniref:VOC family protein n=1 Tax=Noviherbaspirillum saxi TaxID=2320863 RepID=A0A3A3FPU9_9BURK|nr:VOC family protein [Noviherbaspirillum saxi]RJF95482.1 VOC family protein [Noviherbaspirillum saxi]